MHGLMRGRWRSAEVHARARVCKLPSEADRACARQSLRPWEEVISETGQSSQAGANPVRSKPSQRAGSESCVVYGQPYLRSGDSERMGRR